MWNYVSNFLLFMITLGWPFVFLAWVIIQTKQQNKIASLIVSSNLRLIPEVAQHANMSEDKVIKILRKLISGSTWGTVSNDAKYLKDAKLNLQTMEITLSDKHIEKEPWTCVYCRTINTPEELICQSCQAPKKSVST